MGAKSSEHRWLNSVSLVALLSTVICGPMLWLHRDSARNLISFHGTLHAALGQRFETGVIPPENPYFAGKTVRYYWFYHAVGYVLAQTVNISVIYAFEILSVLSVIIVAAAAVALGRRLHGTSAIGAVIFLLVMAGANPFGWGILLAKVIRDGPRIMKGPADAVVAPMLQQVQFDDHRFGPNFTYFMHMTSRAAAIALLILTVWLLWEWLSKGRKGQVILLPLTVALMVALNPVLGMAAVGALALSLLAIHVWQGGGATLLGDPKRLSRLISGALLLCIGGMLALPTMLNILGKSTNVPTIRIDPTRLQLYGVIAVNGFPLLLIAILGANAGDNVTRAFARMLLIAGAILLAWTALLAMPGVIPPRGVIGNEHNLFNAAMVLLAVPAAGWVMLDRPFPAGTWLRSRSRRIMAMLGVFLPTAILILTTYAGRAQVPVRCAPARLIWTMTDQPVARLYDWVVAHTSEDAVFIVDPEARVDRLCNVSDFPAFTNRTVYTDFSTYMTEAYPEEAFRLQWSKVIARGEPVPADVRHTLSLLSRPIYILTHQMEDADLSARLNKRYGIPIFQANSIAVFNWSKPNDEAIKLPVG